MNAAFCNSGISMRDHLPSSLLTPAIPARSAAAAKSVPFRARLDEQGPLARLEIDLRVVLAVPRSKGDTGLLALKYADHGAPIGLAPPTGEVLEATAAMLARL